MLTEPDGSAVHPDEFRRRFNGHVKAAGVKRITPHGLRHTFASNALAAGVPLKIVSTILGQSTISITADVYAHALPAQFTEAAAVVETMYQAASGG